VGALSSLGYYVEISTISQYTASQFSSEGISRPFLIHSFTEGGTIYAQVYNASYLFHFPLQLLALIPRLTVFVIRLHHTGPGVHKLLFA
jgi:hypothetical protein